MALITGTAADDILDGTSAADDIEGLAGDDTLSGLQGEDALFGGDGNDILRGGSGRDFLFGGRGSDILIGTRIAAEDTGDSDVDVARYDRDAATRGVVVNLATGRARDGFGDFDFLLDMEGVFGTAFADRLTGGNAANDGYEVFAGLAGADTIAGGSGLDELRYDRDAAAGGTAAVIVNLTAGTARDGFGDTDLLSGIERVRGTAGADRFTGDAAANFFVGLAGSDSMNGAGGSDWVDYRRDDEYGGLSGVTVNLGTGTATDGFGSIDTLVSIENAWGTRFADSVTGSDGANILDLGRGNDTAWGGLGNDTIDGAIGQDRLFGGGRRDRLTGGFGADTLTGGGGVDTFVFDDPANGRDTITDFAAGETIALSADAFGLVKGQALVAGTTFFATTDPSLATGTGLSVIYETDAGRVWFDFDGAGGAAPILLATLTGAPAVTAANFAIY